MPFEDVTFTVHLNFCKPVDSWHVFAPERKRPWSRFGKFWGDCWTSSSRCDFLILQSEISPAFASWTSAIWTAAHHLGGLYQAFLLLVDYFWCFLFGNFKSNDPSKRTFIRVQKRLAWSGVVVEDELWMQWSQTLAGLLRTGDGTIARQGFVYVIICKYMYIYIYTSASTGISYHARRKKDFIKSRNCGVWTGVSEIPNHHFEQVPKNIRHLKHLKVGSQETFGESFFLKIYERSVAVSPLYFQWSCCQNTGKGTQCEKIKELTMVTGSAVSNRRVDWKKGCYGIVVVVVFVVVDGSSLCKIWPVALLIFRQG